MTTQWYPLETTADYKLVMEQYQLVKDAKKTSTDHKEKMLVATLIQQYEASKWDMPELDPIELIKIRMGDFGYRSADVAAAYGDKGTVSKVLNYKQPLSLNMIRKFSTLLRIPTGALIKDYQLET